MATTQSKLSGIITITMIEDTSANMATKQMRGEAGAQELRRTRREGPIAGDIHERQHTRQRRHHALKPLQYDHENYINTNGARAEGRGQRLGKGRCLEASNTAKLLASETLLALITTITLRAGNV